MHGRKLGPFRRNQRPVLLPFSALQNPLTDKVDLLGRKFFAEFRLRHTQFFIGRADAAEQFTLFRLSGNENDDLATITECAFFCVEAQVSFTLVLVGPVASKAVVRQNGPNVPVEFNSPKPRGGVARTRLRSLSNPAIPDKKTQTDPRPKPSG